MGQPGQNRQDLKRMMWPSGLRNMGVKEGRNYVAQVVTLLCDKLDELGHAPHPSNHMTSLNMPGQLASFRLGYHPLSHQNPKPHEDHRSVFFCAI
eukprot:1394905-Amorphochlora_amoeboformis.AAC.3